MILRTSRAPFVVIELTLKLLEVLHLV